MTPLRGSAEKHFFAGFTGKMVHSLNQNDDESVRHEAPQAHIEAGWSYGQYGPSGTLSDPFPAHPRAEFDEKLLNPRNRPENQQKS